MPPTAPSLNMKLLLGIVAAIIFFFILALIAVFATTRQSTNSNAPVTLTVWGFDDQAVYQQTFDTFTQNHPNVKIRYEKQPLAHYFDKVLNRKASDVDRPDVFLFHDTWVPELGSVLTTVPPTVLSSADYKNTFYKVAQTNLASGNSFLGFPQSIDGLVLIYNPSLLAAKTIIPEKDFADWQSFYNAVVRLTDKDTQGNIKTAGAAIGTSKNVPFFSDIIGLMYLQQDINHLNDLGQSDTGNDIIDFYTRFASGFDRVWDTSMGSDTDAFAQQKVAVIFGTAQTVQTVKNANPQLALGVAPMPQLRTNDPKDWASYWVWGVSQQSSQQMLSWQLAWQLSSKVALVRANQVRKTEGVAQLPYPRTDLVNFQINDPVFSVFLQQAQFDRSFPFANLTLDTTATGNGLDTANVVALDLAITSIVAGNTPDLSVTRTAILHNLHTYNINLQPTTPQ